MRISMERIEEREEKLAVLEYQMNYIDLPGDVKSNIHNYVLEELGMRKKLKLVCSVCGIMYEEDVEDYIDHTETSKSVCSSCQERKNREVEEEELVAEFEKTLAQNKNFGKNKVNT